MCCILGRGRTTIPGGNLPGNKAFTYQCANKPEITVLEQDARPQGGAPATRFVQNISKESVFRYRQNENDFIDFKCGSRLFPPLQPQRPVLCAADVNGDGLQDVYIGGAAGFAGKLMIQNATGAFVENQRLPLQPIKSMKT